MMRRLILARPWQRHGLALSCPAITGLKTVARYQSTAAQRRLLFENDNFLTGTSAQYIDDLYEMWKADANSVDSSWHAVFEARAAGQFDSPLLNTPIRVIPQLQASDGYNGPEVKQSMADCARLTWMIQSFEDRGHLKAQTDPLNYEDEDPTTRTPSRKYKQPLRLDLAYFGFKRADEDRLVSVGFLDVVGGLLSRSTQPMTIKELHSYLVRRYCGKVGYEISHVVDETVARYLRNITEGYDETDPIDRVLTREDKMWIWDKIASAVFFEDFFKRKYSTQKRFGADGAESCVLGLLSLFNSAQKFGVEKVNLGMAHRGRLNVLYHGVGKPFEVLLKEFEGIKAEDIKPFQIQSDVKYHLGGRGEVALRNGKTIVCELLCNPSHLEAVNPFVQGLTRAEQVRAGPDGRSKIMPVEIHGDAAFSGQGIAFETMGISEVGEHGTGGTIHIVINNQIGFTTDPKSSRSSAYCTDLGRVFQCPIFHVNGDSPEDVARVFDLAAEFRARFKRSVVIDLVCYRRFGHNENDDPMITQPLMYNRIHSIPDVFRRYSDALVAEGVITPQDVTAKSVFHKEKYGSYHDKAAKVNYSEYLRSMIPTKWRGMKYSDEFGKATAQPTAVTADEIEMISKALNTYPSDLVVNPKLKVVLDRRYASLVAGKDIEWGTAEALAFGTLLMEGFHVRVTGQDVERGTFSQRHAVVHDQSKVGQYTQLQHVSPDQASFIITNSPLSEYGMLGYAAGYALSDPNMLVMWEAQYADFANGATIIFDQFLSSGESKWNQQQAVIVSMPHGYDGKGPEHSSGRIERFLQSVDEDVTTPAYSPVERAHRVNWEICYPTTPAQYFHLLRRHVKRDFRKALTIFFSKQYLRTPNVSTIEEFTSGQFYPVIEDKSVPPANARKLVFCTGQIYHILNKHRQAIKNTDVAIVRIEELSPFPVAEVQKLLAEYGNAELLWVQEEPKNNGAFWHVEPRIEYYTNGTRPLKYVGRETAASPSTGYKSAHDAEQKMICERTFA